MNMTINPGATSLSGSHAPAWEPVIPKMFTYHENLLALSALSVGR